MIEPDFTDETSGLANVQKRRAREQAPRRHTLLTALAWGGIAIFIGCIVTILISSLIQQIHTHGWPSVHEVLVFAGILIIILWTYWAVLYLLIFRK